METALLPTPSPKKNCRLQKEYPFPIVLKNDQSVASTSTAESTLKWKCFIGYLQENCVHVTDENSIRTLYSMGFFGKGTLSKRAPGVCIAAKRAEQSEAKACSESSDDDQELSKRPRIDEDIDVEEQKCDVVNDSSSSSSISDEEGNDDDIIESSSIEQSFKEKLQLTFEEAFFLSYGLGCLVVMDKDQPLGLLRLWQRLCELSLDSNFPVMYTAYHHFRSKGWIVRNGLKYGADFVLYKDGPPFYHSTYAVIVKPVKEKRLREINTKNGQLHWSNLSTFNRVNTHAAKSVMLLYVIKPEIISDYKISTPFCVSQFKLQEVLFKRWVPSSSREDNA